MIAVNLFDVLAQQLVRVELSRAERTDGRLGRDAEVSAQVNAQVVFVLVGARADVARERPGTRVHGQVLVVLRLEEERLVAEVTLVDLLFAGGASGGDGRADRRLDVEGTGLRRLSIAGYRDDGGRDAALAVGVDILRRRR